MTGWTEREHRSRRAPRSGEPSYLGITPCHSQGTSELGPSPQAAAG